MKICIDVLHMKGNNDSGKIRKEKGDRRERNNYCMLASIAFSKHDVRNEIETASYGITSWRLKETNNQ